MSGLVLVLAVATVLQGEAGPLGPDAMTAVADTMIARKVSPDFPNSWPEVLEAYYARADPSPEAIAIAYRAVTTPWTPGRYFFAYSAEDRARRGWRRGDRVIEGHRLQLHLAASWPADPSDRR